MAELIDVGGRRRLQEMIDGLHRRIPEEVLQPVAKAMAEDAASRAPSPEEELLVMLYGGNTPADILTREKRTSDIRRGTIVHEDNRVRFVKPFANYLHNFVGQSYIVDDFTIGVGLIPQLNASSVYEYVNIDGKGGEYDHLVTYPFWQSWEHGGIFTIYSKQYGGRKYPLRPGQNWQVRWPEQPMIKVIPAHFMYSSINVHRILDIEFFPRVQKIVRSYAG